MKFNKVERRNEKDKRDLLLIILISCLAYYIITYLGGLFVGFVYTTYSKSPLGMLRNIFSCFVMVVLIEVIREIVIKKGKYYKSIIIFSPIVFTLLEAAASLNIVQLSSRHIGLEMLLIVVVPLLCKNILLTFITYYSDKDIAIIYHLLMNIPVYFLPIFPAFSDYLNTTLIAIQSTLTIIVALRILYFRREKIEDARKYLNIDRMQKAFNAILIGLLIVLIYLVSNIGRYTIIAIGSGSMNGTINKGDVVLLDKKVKHYEEGDIIAFEQDGVVVVHRIVGVDKDNDVYSYHTKGDANNAMDMWEVKETSIVGHYIGRGLYIGWPTIILSEYLEEK
jgi:signal peptidase I